MAGVILICFGASAGALLRWWLGLMLNPLFPAIPFGTLAANLLGGFLMGMLMGLASSHHYLSESARLALATGFLGGLTTFSTFSAETVTLLAHQEFLMAFLIIMGHVAGSILATFLGIYTLKFIVI